MSRKPTPHRVWTMQTVRDRCTEVGDCLIWRQGINSAGYPQTCIHGKPGTSVRKFVFTELLEKIVPTGKRITAKCGNKRCCSEICLIAQPVAKIIQRAHDKRRGDPGTLQRMQEGCPFSKLDREQAREIRSSTESTRVLAARYGISAASTSAIKRGETWREPPQLITSVFALATSMGVA